MIRVNTVQMKKVHRLLDMEYTPKEIEEETTISYQVILSEIRAGKLKARRTNNGKYWIHGLTFTEYIKSTSKKKSDPQDNKFYCFKCHKIVYTLEEIQIKNKIAHGVCPECKNQMGKIATIAQRKSIK